MQIRPARTEDYSSIRSIITDAQHFIASSGSDQWQDGYPEPERISLDIQTGIGFVAEEDSHVCAYYVLSPAHEPNYDSLGSWLNPSGNYLTVHRMAIASGSRGTGLGKTMLEFACEFARSRGILSVRADTHRMNKPMQGLMRKCGFTFCGEVSYPECLGDPIRLAYEIIL